MPALSFGPEWSWVGVARGLSSCGKFAAAKKRKGHHRNQAQHIKHFSGETSLFCGTTLAYLQQKAINSWLIQQSLMLQLSPRPLISSPWDFLVCLFPTLCLLGKKVLFMMQMNFRQEGDLQLKTFYLHFDVLHRILVAVKVVHRRIEKRDFARVW